MARGGQVLLTHLDQSGWVGGGGGGGRGGGGGGGRVKERGEQTEKREIKREDF